MSIVTISSKGWIVIPAEYRKKYKLSPGDQVRIVDYGGLLTIVPVLSDPIRQARGILKGGPSLVQDLLDERKKEQAREENRASRIRS